MGGEAGDSSSGSQPDSEEVFDSVSSSGAGSDEEEMVGASSRSASDAEPEEAAGQESGESSSDSDDNVDEMSPADAMAWARTNKNVRLRLAFCADSLMSMGQLSFGSLLPFRSTAALGGGKTFGRSVSGFILALGLREIFLIHAAACSLVFGVVAASEGAAERRSYQSTAMPCASNDWHSIEPIVVLPLTPGHFPFGCGQLDEHFLIP